MLFPLTKKVLKGCFLPFSAFVCYSHEQRILQNLAFYLFWHLYLIHLKIVKYYSWHLCVILVNQKDNKMLLGIFISICVVCYSRYNCWNKELTKSIAEYSYLPVVALLFLIINKEHHKILTHFLEISMLLLLTKNIRKFRAFSTCNFRLL